VSHVDKAFKAINGDEVRDEQAKEKAELKCQSV
jgi:hypothetical protein